MTGLSYGTFEAILRRHIKPKINKLDLANILLVAPILGIEEGEREFIRSTHSVDSVMVTRICSGKRGIPPRILTYYTNPNALTYIKESFELDLIPRILGGDQEALLRELLSEIEQDDGLSNEEKNHFHKITVQEDLAAFLAEVYMCAINKKPTAQRIDNLSRTNPFFCGRETFLERLNENFQNGVYIQGLFGMGGAGKTQLALQYAHLHSSDYGTIWWINAENKAALQNSISKFLFAHKAMPREGSADNVRLAFLDYCRKYNNWLLIYDNAEYGTEEEYRILTEYFPKSPVKGHILLTTRCKNPFEDDLHTEIPVFSSEEAVEFLQQRSRLDDSQNAETVARQLGFLPLALEYAAAYIRETPNVDYITYSEKLEHYGIKVLDRKVGYQAYKNTVREAFHITLDRLLEDAIANPISKGAEQFLYICSFLAAEGIDIGIFSDYGKGLPDPVKSVLSNELDRDELVRVLTRYSLVQVDRDLMSMHRLLQEVLRDELEPSAEMLCINYAYGVFYSIFYSLRSVPLNRTKRFLNDSVPHVQSILRRYVQRYQQSNQPIPDNIMIAKEYFSWTSLLIMDIKHLDDHELVDACTRNIAVLQAAVDFYEMIPGKMTIYPAFILLLLAQAYETIGNTPAALACYLKALEISDGVINELPVEPDMQQSGTVQFQYYLEALQLATDICAAIGSSSTVRYDTKLLWGNLSGLMKIAQKRMLYGSKVSDPGGYKEAVRFLWLFSCQVADYTQRAFSLRLDVPRKLRQERDGISLDGPFGFFCPATDTKVESEADLLNGFDILMDRDVNTIPETLGGGWNTLAFSDNIRSAEDMMIALMELEQQVSDVSSKRCLFSMIYELARYLHLDDIRTQYQEKLGNKQSLT